MSKWVIGIEVESELSIRTPRNLDTSFSKNSHIYSIHNRHFLTTYN